MSKGADHRLNRCFKVAAAVAKRAVRLQTLEAEGNNH